MQVDITWQNICEELPKLIAEPKVYLPSSQPYPNAEDRMFREAVSWRIASDLVEAFPHLSILETHPGGGQYDCLSLFEDRRQNLMDINRVGSIHFHRSNNRDVEKVDLWKLIASGEPYSLAREKLAENLGLSLPKTLRENNHISRTYQIMAAVVAMVFELGHQGEFRTGFVDTGYGAALSNAFDVFPDASERVKVEEWSDFFNQPSYRFWFLFFDGIPVMCVEIGKSFWIRPGETVIEKLIFDDDIK